MIQQPLIIALAFFTGAFAMWTIMQRIHRPQNSPSGLKGRTPQADGVADTPNPKLGETL